MHTNVEMPKTSETISNAHKAYIVNVTRDSSLQMSRNSQKVQLYKSLLFSLQNIDYLNFTVLEST